MDIFGNSPSKEIVEGSGVDQGTFSRVKNGERALSVKAARAIGAKVDASPASLFAATQANVLARKSVSGEATPAHVIAESGRILKALQDHFGGEVDTDDQLLRDALKMLMATAEKALADDPSLAVATKDAKPQTTYEALGRDTSGLKVEKGRQDVPAAEKTAGPSGRDAGGLRRNKKYGT